MGDSICLDTDFLVDLLRNKSEAVQWVKEHEDEDILATTIVNVYEIYSGAYKSALESKILAVKEL